MAFGLCASLAMAAEPPAPVRTVSQALAVASDSPRFPADASATLQALPDDWSQSRPGYEGSVWYRVSFDAPVRQPTRRPCSRSTSSGCARTSRCI